MNYSIVIPVHNEAENLVPLVEEILTATAADPPRRVVLVDDASTDGTADEARDLRRAHGPLIQLIRNRQQCGQSASLWNGVEAADTPWIVTMDGDRQNDPVDVPAVLATLAEASGDKLLVIGHRITRQDSWPKRFASRTANAVRGAMLKDRAPDTGCGLKGFSRRLFLELPYFDHMHRFMPALVLQHGGDVVSIPVRHRPRPAGESKYGVFDRLWVGIFDLFGVAWLARRNRRTEWVKDNA